MKYLEEMIEREGRVLSGEILKVDKFINHCIDVDLFDKMGKAFHETFKDRGVTKILTLEVSGIGIAVMAGYHFKVPVVFAKKTVSKTLGSDVYRSSVYSFTKGVTYDIMVSRDFLCEDDRVLLIDDFLANGKALEGMIDIVKQADAQVVGIGIAIEKAFQAGGENIRKQGYDIRSLAVIDHFEDGKVVFASGD